jgi:hypothetical protein
MHPLVWLDLVSSSVPPVALRQPPDTAHVAILTTRDITGSDRDAPIGRREGPLAPFEGRLHRAGGNR